MDAQTVLDYHRRTEHHVDRYAAGPETLDWDAQPNPFREFAGAARIPLPLRTTRDGRDDPRPFAELPAAQPYPFDLPSLAYLLELSMGLAAWKEYGPDRWALRCNPSSGNLHPTECYVLVFGLAGLHDGLYHYVSRDHALERRWQPADNQNAITPSLHIGLTSINWREAWKYGERAFRYCQLDTGHAIGALRYAAALLGWGVGMVPNLDHDQLAGLMGLDRGDDFAKAEPEEPELLLGVTVPGKTDSAPVAPNLIAEGSWTGSANLLDPHPFYRWPIIDQVAEASRAPHPAAHPAAEAEFVGAEGENGSELWPEHWHATWPEITRTPRTDTSAAESKQSGPLTAAVVPPPLSAPRTATAVIRGRRSAQHFNPKVAMPADTFFDILARLLPPEIASGETGDPPRLPWDSLPVEPHLHLLIFVHRVAGLQPGLYALPRSAEGETILRDQLHAGFAWQPIEVVTDESAEVGSEIAGKLAEATANEGESVQPGQTGGHRQERLPLYLLLPGDLRRVAKGFSCQQSIASDSCFALSMVAEFAPLIEEAPERYRHLHWEAGLIGQVLYLEAEAAGFNGTGIGCFFDAATREGFGIKDDRLTPLYHFTVGQALFDSRISTLPPYPHRTNTEQPADQAGAAQQ
ncbi:hypothetical protein A9404_01535 [Halothiobacillus diazotrophicus]|uniref:Nitroreductase domain-containing protein n=1 Tax=Halothiobacillus diazotrophicus TaxID=1860122 RepID=A0A191ZED4_9GAMM|nr:hypothetical protein A9404_01535 [Halothiobacillus diazotrophicus]